MSLKNFMSYEDAEEVLGEYADAINSLKSGLTNYQAQNDLNLEVPNRKNLFDPNSKLQLGFSNSIGTGGTFTSGSYYAYVVTKHSVPTFTISGVDYTKIEDASIRVFVSSSYPAVGVAQLRTSNISDLSSKTVTLSENDKYITFLIKWEDTATQADKESIMVEEGFTATTFAPYIPSVDARLDAVESGIAGLTNVTGILTISSNSDLSKLKTGVNAVLVSRGMVIGESPFVTPVTLANNCRGFIMREGNNIYGIIGTYDQSAVYLISSGTVSNIVYYATLIGS